MQIKIKHFSGDKQNFQTKVCLFKWIIEIQEAIKLLLDEIVNHPSQIFATCHPLSMSLLYTQKFLFLAFLMMFLMMVLYLVSCNQKF